VRAAHSGKVGDRAVRVQDGNSDSVKRPIAGYFQHVVNSSAGDGAEARSDLLVTVVNGVGGTQFVGKDQCLTWCRLKTVLVHWQRIHWVTHNTGQKGTIC
jgi:hypothetical protein